jgi:hypothetical protein
MDNITARMHRQKTTATNYMKKVYLINSGIRIYRVAFLDLNQCRHIIIAASDIFLH